MKDNKRVFIIDEDPFSLGWSSLILARDWRSQVVGGVTGLEEGKTLLAKLDRPALSKKIDLILIDAEQLITARGKISWREKLKPFSAIPLILLLAKNTDPIIYGGIDLDLKNLCGYLVKSEICDSLGWAVALAQPGRWVITPSVERLIRPQTTVLPTTILDGRSSRFGWKDPEKQFARLALIFSMGRAELSDENNLGEWAFGKVSKLYKDLGIDEILSGKIDPSEILGVSFTQLPRFKAIQSSVNNLINGKRRRGKDFEALAFHILTMPDVQEINIDRRV